MCTSVHIEHAYYAVLYLLLHPCRWVDEKFFQHISQNAVCDRTISTNFTQAYSASLIRLCFVIFDSNVSDSAF